MAFPEDRHVALAWLVLGSAGIYVPWIYGDAAVLPPVVAMVVLATMVFVTLRPGPDISRAADRHWICQLMLCLLQVQLWQTARKDVKQSREALAAQMRFLNTRTRLLPFSTT